MQVGGAGRKTAALHLIILLDALTDEEREHGEFQGKVSWVRSGHGVHHFSPYFIGQKKVMWLQRRPGNAILCAQEEKRKCFGEQLFSLYHTGMKINRFL